MSRRKIKRKKEKQNLHKTNDVDYMTSTFPIIDPLTGEIDLDCITWEVTHEEMSYMPVYHRAHQLMPQSRSFYMDPNEYKDELAPSIEVLAEAERGNIIDTDTILRALGILGHTPVEQSIRALSVFAQSDHSLAPVAGLALAECSSMYTGVVGN